MPSWPQSPQASGPQEGQSSSDSGHLAMSQSGNHGRRWLQTCMAEARVPNRSLCLGWGAGGRVTTTQREPCHQHPPGLHQPRTGRTGWPPASKVPVPTEARVPGCGLVGPFGCDHWAFLRRSRERGGHCQTSVGSGRGAGTWQPGQATPTREQLGCGLGPDGREGTREPPSTACKGGWWPWEAGVPSWAHREGRAAATACADPHALRCPGAGASHPGGAFLGTPGVPARYQGPHTQDSPGFAWLPASALAQGGGSRRPQPCAPHPAQPTVQSPVGSSPTGPRPAPCAQPCPFWPRRPPRPTHVNTKNRVLEPTSSAAAVATGMYLAGLRRVPGLRGILGAAPPHPSPGPGGRGRQDGQDPAAAAAREEIPPRGRGGAAAC